MKKSSFLRLVILCLTISSGVFADEPEESYADRYVEFKSFLSTDPEKLEVVDKSFNVKYFHNGSFKNKEAFVEIDGFRV